MGIRNKGCPEEERTDMTQAKNWAKDMLDGELCVNPVH
jgi:hypothetical protein